jgi:hypothetical protein
VLPQKRFAALPCSLKVRCGCWRPRVCDMNEFSIPSLELTPWIGIRISAGADVSVGNFNAHPIPHAGLHTIVHPTFPNGCREMRYNSLGRWLDSPNSRIKYTSSMTMSNLPLQDVDLQSNDVHSRRRKTFCSIYRTV